MALLAPRSAVPVGRSLSSSVRTLPLRAVSHRPQRKIATGAASVKAGPPLPIGDLGHTRGDGPTTLAVFLDYSCPFSVKSFNMLYKKVLPHYDGKLRLHFFHQIQPWHPHSTMLHESAMAVAKIAGEDAFWKYSDALFNTMEAYKDEKSFYMTRQQIYDSLVELACTTLPKINKAELKKMLSIQTNAEGKQGGSALTQEVKWVCKLSRQWSVHVSPTTFVNSLLVDTSSSWTLEQWTELLDPLVKAAEAQQLKEENASPEDNFAS